VAILVAAEWPIYGRYGFGPSAVNVEYEVDARAASFVDGGEGEVALVDADALRAAAPEVYEAHRRVTPGAIARSGLWWDRRLGLTGAVWPEPPAGQRFAVVRDEGGAVTGVLVYSVAGHWDQWRPRGTLNVGHLFATTPGAYARLWRFACEVDLVATVVADERGPDEALALLLRDGRAVRERHRTDFQWLRVLDVPAALSARRYACDGALVLEVSDPQGLASGRFALEGGPEGAQCSATDAAPDLVVGSSALGAAYLGGASLVALETAGWLREETPGALARADAMLGWAVAPWCATLF
jgi:predicted acetyltransferase